MADGSSFFTDSDDERAVEDVLSQAMDESMLQQIAAVNCSSFSPSDNLPSHLESRFRKLKSLGPRSHADSDPKSLDQSLPGFCNSVNSNLTPDGKRGLDSLSDIDSPKEPFDRGTDEKRGLDSLSYIDSPKERFDRGTDEKRGLKSKSKSQSKSLSDCSDENPQPEVSEKYPDEKKRLKSKSGAGSSKSRSDSWRLSSPESDLESVSPPRRIGCLWCSPKKEKSVKKGKENRLSSTSSWSKDNEILSDLGTFSTKEQMKIMKKAIKEEEKINREAEKIVKWAKQASARMMDVSELDDEQSDLENHKR